VSTEDVAAARTARGGILRGRVVDAEQRPLANALVRGWCRHDYDPGLAPDRRVRSDELGAFEVRDLGPEFVLDAVAEGLACRQGLRGKLAFGTVAEGELVLVLARATPVAGRVVGPRGEGVPARMDIHASGSWSSADATGVAAVSRFTPVEWRGDADAAGRFAIDALPEGKTYAVSAHCDGYVHRYEHFEPGPEPLEIRMERGATVVGRVIGPDGAPVSGATSKRTARTWRRRARGRGWMAPTSSAGSAPGRRRTSPSLRAATRPRSARASRSRRRRRSASTSCWSAASTSPGA
jgi:hypothetical protein